MGSDEYGESTGIREVHVLSGEGQAAGPSFSITSPVSIQAQDKNSSSFIYPLTLANNGTTSLDLSPLSSSTTDAVITGNTCGKLATGASCQFNLTYNSSSVGAHVITFSSVDAISGKTLSASLNATVYPTPPSASPQSLTFGPIHLGTTASQTFTVTNPYVHPLTLAAACASSSACPTDFHFSPTTCNTATCTITVTYAPVTASSSPSYESSSIRISDPVSSLAANISLTGYAGLGVVTFSPFPLEFSSRPAGTTSTPQTVTVTNTGDGQLNISSVSLTGTNAADYTLANTCGGTLAVGATCTLSVSFSPTATGTRTAAVSISTNPASASGTLPISGTGVSSPITPPSTPVQVYAGHTPVVGASVQIYSVGTTADASPSTPLLSPALVTDATGSVTLSGYTCPSAQAIVYLVATGSNPALTLMTAIGPCGSITTTPLVINELTTVAAVNALVPYMTSATTVGSGPADAVALGNAFTLASQFVNPSTGAAPGTNVPSGYIVPVATINTLGNILNTCTASTDGSTCGPLFALATQPGKATPTDSLTAMLAVAGNPIFNTYSLYTLTNSTQPFQPALTSLPGDFGVRLLPAGLTASTTSINFGSVPYPPNPVPLNPLTVILTNNTSAPVALSTPVFTGDTTHFSVASEVLFNFPAQANLCETSLPVGGSCALIVNFAPDSSASFAATLTIANTSSTPSLSIALTGEGVPAVATGLVASPTSLNFTSIDTPQDVTLTNSGTTPVTINSISFVQDPTTITAIAPIKPPLTIASAPFSQTNNCGASLAPAASCVISISATNSLTVPDSIFNNQIVPINAYLSLVVNGGTVVQPVNVQYGNSQGLDFGSWSVGIQGPPRVLSVNGPPVSGETPITVNATITGPNASDFSFSPTELVSTFYCNGPQAFGCYLQNNIYFTPSATGTSNATVSYSLDEISGSTRLTGVGLPAGPHFVITPRTPSFQMTAFGSSTPPVTLTVTNSGTETLNFGAPTITGPNASDFAASTTCSTLAVTPTASTCTLTVTSTPSGNGARSATLTLKDTTSGVQQTVPLYVYGTWPSPSPDVSGLSFPSTPAGTTSAPQTVTFTYHQGDPITVTISPGTPAAAFQIPAGFTCTSSPCAIPVTFSPPATNTTYYGSITVTDKLSGGTSVSLSGKSPPPPPLLSFSPASLTFSSTVGTASTPQIVTVTNIATGGQTVDLTSIAIPNPTNGYSLTNSCPSALAPKATCTFAVSFNATAVGTFNAGVSIVSNSPSSPDTVPLTGTGSVSQVAPTITPFQLAFPPAPLTTVRPTQTFTITNSALHPLTIAANAGCAGACATDFSLSAYTCSTASCVITVTYAPKVAVSYESGNFTVTDTLNGQRASIFVSGIAGLSHLTITPTPLSFPNQTVGTKSTTESFTVSNTGDGYGTISVGTLSGPDFQYSGTTQVQIAPNHTQSLPYAFIPIETGDRSATVQILDITTTPNIPLTILTLTGTGVAP